MFSRHFSWPRSLGEQVRAILSAVTLLVVAASQQIEFRYMHESKKSPTGPTVHGPRKNLSISHSSIATYLVRSVGIRSHSSFWWNEWLKLLGFVELVFFLACFTKVNHQWYHHLGYYVLYVSELFPSTFRSNMFQILYGKLVGAKKLDHVPFVPCTSRWWQLKHFLFSPRNLGKMNPFWRAYFSNGLVTNHQLDI